MSIFDGNNDDPVDSIYLEESLMASLDAEPRIITLANPANTTLLGFVLTETEDSFLVGHPSRLTESDGVPSIEPFIPVAYVRLLKSNVSMVIPMFGDFEIYYLEYLKNKANELYPELAEDVDFYLSKLLENSAVPSSEKSIEDFEEALKEATADGKVVSINSIITKH